MDYETVIGLEVHVQLSTKSKIFSRAAASFGAAPNENIDPIVFGLPGSLPVLNEKVVDSAIMMGLALNVSNVRPQRATAAAPKSSTTPSFRSEWNRSCNVRSMRPET